PKLRLPIDARLDERLETGTHAERRERAQDFDLERRERAGRFLALLGDQLGLLAGDFAHFGERSGDLLLLLLVFGGVDPEGNDEGVDDVHERSFVATTSLCRFTAL